jgi:hypothetical protein
MDCGRTDIPTENQQFFFVTISKIDFACLFGFTRVGCESIPAIEMFATDSDIERHAGNSQSLPIRFTVSAFLVSNRNGELLQSVPYIYSIICGPL